MCKQLCTYNCLKLSTPQLQAWWEANSCQKLPLEPSLLPLRSICPLFGVLGISEEIVVASCTLRSLSCIDDCQRHQLGAGKNAENNSSYASICALCHLLSQKLPTKTSFVIHAVSWISLGSHYVCMLIYPGYFHRLTPFLFAFDALHHLRPCPYADLSLAQPMTMC